MSGHRHTTHEHEHDFEAEPGLPEPLPDGERLLWQGSPSWTMLARDAFHARKLLVYFGVLLAWRVGHSIAAGEPWIDTASAAASALLLAAVAIGIVLGLARMSARTSLYTITDRRVVMRVGIVLSVTFNLPFRGIEAANVRALPGGHGDIALALEPATRIAWPHLWPHVRPWHVARTQPSLRSIADVDTVAAILGRAWRAETSATVTHLQRKPARTPSTVPLAVPEAA